MKRYRFIFLMFFLTLTACGVLPAESRIPIDPTGTHTQVPPSATASSTPTPIITFTPTRTLMPTFSPTPLYVTIDLRIACGQNVGINNGVPIESTDLYFLWDNAGSPGNPVMFGEQPVQVPLLSGEGLSGVVSASFSVPGNDRTMFDIRGLTPETNCVFFWGTESGVVGGVAPYQIVVGGKVGQNITLWAGVDGVEGLPDRIQFYIPGQPQSTPRPTDDNGGTDPSRTPYPTNEIPPTPIETTQP